MSAPAGSSRPPQLLLALVTLYPLAHVVWLSLRAALALDPVPPRSPAWTTTCASPPTSASGTRSATPLYFAVVSVALELVLGLAFALAGAAPRFAAARCSTASILLPWAVPTAVSARMWEWIYNAEIGVLNHLLGAEVNWLGEPGLGAARGDRHGRLEDDAVRRAAARSPGCRGSRTISTTPRRRRRLALDRVRAHHPAAARAGDPGRADLPHHRRLPRVRPVYVLTGGGPANSTETLSIYAYKMLFQTLEFGYGSTLAVSVFVFVGWRRCLLAACCGGAGVRRLALGRLAAVMACSSRRSSVAGAHLAQARVRSSTRCRRSCPRAHPRALRGHLPRTPFGA